MEKTLARDYEYINSSPLFTDVTYRWSKPATKREISKVEKLLKRPMPTPLREFYEQVAQKVNISWNAYNKLNRSMHIGRCKITRPSKLIDPLLTYSKVDGSWYSEPWYAKAQNSKVSIELDRLFILDDLGQGNLVLLHLPLGTEAHQLYLYKHPNYFEKVEIEVGEYLKLAIQFKGLYLWQSFFLDEQANSERISSSLADLKELFPYESFPEDVISETYRPLESYWKNLDDKGQDYFLLVNQLKNKLGKQASINIVHFITEAGVDLQTIDRIHRTTTKDLPAAALNFYRQFNGLEIQWFHTGANDGTGGLIKVLPLEKMFGGEQGRWAKDWQAENFEGMMWFSVQKKEEPHWVDELRPYLPVEAIVEAKWLLTAKDKPFKELMLLFGNQLYPIEMDVESYFSLMIRVGGIENWQYFFVSPKILPLIDEMPFDYSTLQQLFPEVDIKALRDAAFSKESN